MAAGAKVVRWWRWLVAAAAALAAALGAPLPDGNDLEGPATPSYVQHVLPSFGSAVFGDPDEQIGEKVSAWSNESGVNPEELGEYAEGDILFPATARNGLATTMARWPEGVVPYKFSSQFSYRDQELLQEAFRHYHEFTCIKFVPYTNQPDYIYITSSSTGCWSSVGRVGGMQEVNLQSPGCTSTVGTPIHELMHALGFLHEQNRWERDRYVTIHWENIQQGREDNFQAATKESTDDYGVPYDYDSVMHYSANAFTKNGRPTIVPMDSNAQLGQRRGLSKGDIKKLNSMYGCKMSELPKRNSSIASFIDNISAFFG
ncbi:hypothetical protein R5R35_007184 [Gryllus longicercus]|uniref:Metalloendopeptidase n=1 Tax=Gryllus longicercus TaxID=2509291 RepID=A0AAN9VM88_9ORTH